MSFQQYELDGQMHISVAWTAQRKYTPVYRNGIEIWFMCLIAFLQSTIVILAFDRHTRYLI